MSAAFLMLAYAMSGWHEPANSRKSSLVAFFVQCNLLPRSGMFPAALEGPVRPG
jgi:hypothetical protein